MNPSSDQPEDRESLRERIIGMGESSVHKSYYPLLQQRLSELERFRALIDETHDMILVIKTPENTCVEVNHAGSARLGFSPEQLANLEIAALVVPEKREQFQVLLLHAAESGAQEKIETTLCSAQGRMIPAELSIHFVTIDQQKYGVIVARDISERLRYERALVATQKKLNLINSLTRNDIKSQIFIVRAYLDVLRQIAKHPEEITILEKLAGTTLDIQNHIELAENYQKLGVHHPRWQNFSGVLLYAISHLPPIPITRCTDMDRLEILSDPLLEKGLTHLMEFMYAHGGMTVPVQLSHEEVDEGLTLTFLKTGTGLPPEQRESVFVWAPAKTSGPNLFFTKEILDMTGISIAENGDAGMLRFIIRVPKDGYRFQV
ncbi:PAS domain S-box protein [Methanoregula sp. UBA64]|jgi:PAS domain S-box-containing protein|uniref:PAS domain S-box protein n=1 Tax=Methanoregula sp. UBA64 TaxID=1915554 RepID=UPI0025EC963E|nr:PAS domain S-box protein [Methanoregula sp. UBA64]